MVVERMAALASDERQDTTGLLVVKVLEQVERRQLSVVLVVDLGD